MNFYDLYHFRALKHFMPLFITYRLFILFLVTLLVSCSGPNVPEPSTPPKIISTTSSIISSKSYRLPFGQFKGVLWPSDESGNFEIWIIQGSKELFHHIKLTPPIDQNYINETSEWEFNSTTERYKKLTYDISNTNNNSRLRIELPPASDGYKFSVLRSKENKRYILFFNISESYIFDGYFGYVVLGTL